MTSARTTLVVTKIEQETDEIRSFYLEPADGVQLAPWSAGAHLHVELPSGLIRQYSLSGDPEQTAFYRLSVLLERSGRGGSAEMHTVVQEGDKIPVKGPSNHFALLDAPGYLFLAGGIGITPILPMLKAVQRAGRPWRLVYGGRSRRSLAFVDDLAALSGGVLVVVPQDEDGLPDIRGEITDAPDAWKVYACGPPGLLAAAEAECVRAGRGQNLRLERFTPDPDADDGVAKADDTSFEVELRRSGKTLSVPADRSILDVVRQEVADVEFDCREGFCGTCETRVLEGEVEHRDSLLDDDERASNTTMMICVSRSHSPRLVLDV